MAAKAGGSRHPTNFGKSCAVKLPDDFGKIRERKKIGGRGSGRQWHCGAKDTTNDYRALDIRRWQREGLLVPGRAFGWNWLRNNETVASIQVRAESDRIILSYRHRSGGGEWKARSIRCGWTGCPARGCGKRVAILYGGGILACRHCYRLAYPSPRESADDRAARRADRIRARLGRELGILNGSGWKPKGMHWKTFGGIKAEHDALVEVAGMARRLGLLQAKLNGFLEK
jgi:hypothetical protein